MFKQKSNLLSPAEICKYHITNIRSIETMSKGLVVVTPYTISKYKSDLENNIVIKAILDKSIEESILLLNDKVYIFINDKRYGEKSNKDKHNSIPFSLVYCNNINEDHIIQSIKSSSLQYCIGVSFKSICNYVSFACVSILNMIKPKFYSINKYRYSIYRY